MSIPSVTLPALNFLAGRFQPFRSLRCGYKPLSSLLQGHVVRKLEYDGNKERLESFTSLIKEFIGYVFQDLDQRRLTLLSLKLETQECDNIISFFFLSVSWNPLLVTLVFFLVPFRSQLSQMPISVSISIFFFSVESNSSVLHPFY